MAYLRRLNGKLDSHRERFTLAVLNGERKTATEIVRNALNLTSSPFAVYLEILEPSQISVGESWLEGSINVAQEHLATQLTLEQMDYLRNALEPRSRNGHLAVITAIEGDRHALGARIVADFLYFDGWDVDFLGPDTPTQDLIEHVRKRQADLVAISVTVPENLSKLREAVHLLKQLPTHPNIMVGGSATFDSVFSEMQEELQLDAVARDALEATQLARELIGLDDSSKSLDVYLKEIGSRIQSIRKSKKWSQQQLGDAADLDRTYISALEHGKQNLTISALKRVADALGVPIEELIIDRVF